MIPFQRDMAVSMATMTVDEVPRPEPGGRIALKVYFAALVNVHGLKGRCHKVSFPSYT